MNKRNQTRILAALLTCGLTAMSSCSNDDKPVNNPVKEITSMADLKGKIVGVEAGNIYDEELAGQTDFTIKKYESTLEGIKALGRGEIDAFKDDEIALSPTETKRQGVKIGFRDERSFDIAFAFRKDSQALVDAFNAFLADIRQNGLYEEIYARWFNTDNPEQVDMPAIALPTEGKVLPVGVNNIIAPMAFQSAGEWSGFEIELIRRFAASQNRPLSITLYTIADIPTALQSGAIDLWSGEIFITPERQQLYLFSDPYFACHPAWFVRCAK